MVGRITKGRTIGGALRYNARKVAASEAAVLFANKVLGDCGPSDAFDMRRALLSFRPYLDTDHAVSDVVFHASLNPDSRDTLTDEQLADIAREYMERMGYGEQPYYVFKHHDIDRPHIHIVSLRIRDDGTAIPDSNDFRRSKAILQDIEQKYNLHPAREGDEKRVYDTVRRVEYGRRDLTQQLRSVVRLLAQDYRYGSLSEFRTLLNLYNVDLEHRRGMAAGKAYEGIVYTSTDRSGKWLGRPVKASALTPKGSLKFLQNRIERNKTALKDEAVKSPIRTTIARAMHQAHTKEEFTALLKADGIDAVLRQNPEGRITGATFIDHRTKTVLNGSHLGKAYSANVLEELFHNPRADREALLPKLPAPTVAPQVIPEPQAARPRPVLVPDAVEKMRAMLPQAAERIPAQTSGLSPQPPSLFSGVGGTLADIAGRVFDELPDEQTGMTPEELDAWRDNIRRRRSQKRKRSQHL